MRLKIDQLQQIVKQAFVEERKYDALRLEINRVLGPSVVTEGKIENVVESANERIDVLEKTGRSGRLDFDPTLVTQFLTHKNDQVRKFATRVAPQNYMQKMANDKNGAVRAVVASRASLHVVREMMKKFPSDDQLRTIYSKRRKLLEAGLPQPKVNDEPFDMYGEERLGDAVKQDEGPELSDEFYSNMAKKLYQDYGHNIEDSWEEIAVKRFVSSTKATSGVELDSDRLLDAVKELINDRDDRALERSALKETLDWLRSREESELLSEVSVMPVIEEEVDEVKDLLESAASPAEFVQKANSIFSIKESTVPPEFKKYYLGEGNMNMTNIPVVGKLPHNKGFRVLDERALDRYCEAWNNKQKLQGEPLRLEWVTHPEGVGKISFSIFFK